MLGKKIIKPLSIDIPVDTFGLYAISITARCQSGKLLGLWGGENLRVEIDDVQFREIPPEKKNQKFDIPPAWNGTVLQGRAKTVIFLLALNKGEHTLKCIPNPSATIEDYSVIPIKDSHNIVFELNTQAEDGDRRPWYTFALINLPLHSLSVDIAVNWHWFDGDDAKLVVDGETEEKLENKRWKNWYWHATTGQVFSGAKREGHSFQKELSQDIHYIELWADRTPMLHTVTLNLGDFTLKLPKRIPTVDDPMWTKDFEDDPPEILLAQIIFGEAANQSKKVKIAVGWSIKNRIGKGELIDPRKRYDDYHDVILDKDQYASLTDPRVRPKLEDPLSLPDPEDRDAWFESYEAATAVIQSKIADPTDGSLFFHDDSMTEEDFLEQVPRATYIKKIGNILFYGLQD